MYDSRFFRSKLGKAAAVSIAAMLAFNLLTLSQQLQAARVLLREPLLDDDPLVVDREHPEADEAGGR